jgi:hypothetical protein
MIFPDIDELNPILNSRLVPSGSGKVTQLSTLGKSNMVDTWMAYSIDFEAADKEGLKRFNFSQALRGRGAERPQFIRFKLF